MFAIPLVLEVNSPLEEMITLHGCSRALIPLACHIERSTASKADAVVVGSAITRPQEITKRFQREIQKLNQEALEQIWHEALQTDRKKHYDKLIELVLERKEQVLKVAKQ